MISYYSNSSSLHLLQLPFIHLKGLLQGGGILGRLVGPDLLEPREADGKAGPAAQLSEAGHVDGAEGHLRSQDLVHHGGAEPAVGLHLRFHAGVFLGDPQRPEFGRHLVNFRL